VLGSPAAPAQSLIASPCDFVGDPLDDLLPRRKAARVLSRLQAALDSADGGLWRRMQRDIMQTREGEEARWGDATIFDSFPCENLNPHYIVVVVRNEGACCEAPGGEEKGREKIFYLDSL